MLKAIITGAFISKGREGAPALQYAEKVNAVRFRIGKKVYDPKAEDNHRWVNFTVKAFGSVCDRIKKMDLKEGSFVNLLGRLDEDSWENEKGYHTQTVIILDEIQYASGGGRSKAAQETTEEPVSAPTAAPPQPAAPAPNTSAYFTGYEVPAGQNSVFFDNRDTLEG